MRVLVTGGAGFIGSHLCDYLLALGHEVAAMDILVPQVHGGQGLQWGRKGEPVPSWPDYMDSRVLQYVCDVGNKAEVFRALQEIQPEIVVHLAAFVGVGQSWYEPSMYLYGGPVITAALLEAVAHHNAGAGTKVRRVFVAGSMSSYGEGPTNQWKESIPTMETDAFDPQNPYAMAKAGGEQVALMLGPTLGVEVVVGRFFNVLGERQALTNPYTGVAAIFSARLLNGEPPLIFEDGQQSRDFIHVSDVVRAIWTIVERAPAGEVYNVGTGKRTTILELAQRLCALHGGGIEPAITGARRKGDIRHCYADASKLRALGWVPEVSLDDALAQLWSWVSEQAVADPAGFARAFGELLGHRLVDGLPADLTDGVSADALGKADLGDLEGDADPEATSAEE